MLRPFVAALFVLTLLVGVTVAEEVKGKIKGVDADRGTITVTVGEKDRTFAVAKDAKVGVGKSKDLKDLKAGQSVTLTTESKNGKDVVTEIKGGGKKEK